MGPPKRATRPIDATVLVRLYGSLGKEASELASELMDTYLAEAPRRIEGLRSALVQRSADEMWRAAHALKGNSDTLGAVTLAALCRELESDARDEDLSRAPNQVARIEAEFHRVRDAMMYERADYLAILDALGEGTDKPKP